MKLREALQKVDRQELYKILCGLEMNKSGIEYSLEECQNAYNPVIEELLQTEDGESPSTIVLVKENGFDDGTEPEIDVYLRFKDIPTERYSLANSPWKDIANSLIENPIFLDSTNVVAEILWELTFDGWTEKEQFEFYKKLKEIVNKSNRKIKFRVWDGNQFDYNCVLETFTESKCFTINDIFEPNPDPELFCVQQFTGFTDRNGKEIYEGDIFKSYTRKWDPVEFENGQWQANLQGARVYSLYEMFDGVATGDYPEVVGNIFENPELL